MLRILSAGRYLARRARAVSQRTLLQREFTALVSFLRESGCTFHSCEALIESPVPRGVSFRYDIHLRDVPGCAAFIDMHRREEIPGTLFLFWDYSKIEREHFRDFMDLAKRAASPLEIGLHDSPVDAYLMQERFAGDRKAYAAWVKSDAMGWIASLLNAPQELEDFNRSVMASFQSRVIETRERFGPITTVASHGGELNQAVRPQLDRLDPAIAKLARQLGRTWLTPERVTAAGLSVNVDGHGQNRRGWREQSDGGGVIQKMARRIRQYVVEEQSALQILIHPYTWSGGKRDGELSALLRP
jgi:hypothetical protein